MTHHARGLLLLSALWLLTASVASAQPLRMLFLSRGMAMDPRLAGELAAGGVSVTQQALTTPLTLSQDGEPAAVILLPVNPTVSAQFAADELQWHLQKMTGAKLSLLTEGAAAPPGCVRLWLGDTARARTLGLTQAAFRPQEHAIRFLPGEIILAGRDADRRDPVKYDPANLAAGDNWPGFFEERGTLDAVYDFLERCCGVRWLNPTETGTILPHSPTLAVRALNLRRTPVFEFRDAIGATGNNAGWYDHYIALWPEATPQFQAYEAAAYPKLHQQYPEGWQYSQAKRMSSWLFLLRMRNGGVARGCNHALYGYYNRFWEKSSDPETAKLFVEKRPGMFAQGYEGQPPQMCYTSRELISQLAQDARDYYDGRKTGAELGIFWRPTLPNPFPVEPMDNSSFCKCPECQAWLKYSRQAPPNTFSTGTHSDYFFNFINQVQKELAKTHPDKSIICLAYASHAMMPSHVKLDRRVAVQYCFACNRSPWDRVNFEHEVRSLKEWGEEGVGRPLYLWLYYTFPVETANNGHYHCFPGFFAHTIGQEFKLFKQYGYRGMFHCGFGQEVEAYVTFKLMDDPEAEVDALLAQYFSGLYGPAAGPMRQLYEEIEATYCNPANYPKERLSGAELSWGCLGTAARMSRFGYLLRKARRLAATEEQRHRVDLFDQSVWSYMVAGRRDYLARKAAAIPALTAPRVPDAAGDVAKVPWSQAAEMGSWYVRGTVEPASRKLSGRVAHDGTFLYVELTDPCDTGKLEASPTVFACDDWELFVAGQRGMPYRQYAVGPTGLQVALSHGEVNFRTNVPLDNPGVRASCDKTAPDRWVTRLALPLDQVIPGGVKPGGKLYLNVLRVTCPALSGTGGLGLDTWVSYSTVHEVDRLAEVTLAP